MATSLADQNCANKVIGVCRAYYRREDTRYDVEPTPRKDVDAIITLIQRVPYDAGSNSENAIFRTYIQENGPQMLTPAVWDAAVAQFGFGVAIRQLGEAATEDLQHRHSDKAAKIFVERLERIPTDFVFQYRDKIAEALDQQITNQIIDIKDTFAARAKPNETIEEKKRHWKADSKVMNSLEKMRPLVSQWLARVVREQLNQHLHTKTLAEQNWSGR